MPARAELRVNLAEALLDLGRHDEAIAELRAALPHLAAPSQARLNLAYALFAAGDWPAAWREFESRFAPDAPRRSARRPDGFTLPRWDGERERGPVFVWSEQGLGDEILFAGLIAAAPEHGIDIVLECDPRLAPLIARAHPRLTIAPRTSPPSPPPASCRAQLAAGSFGGVIGWTPRAHTPRAYLAADPARTAFLRQRLGGGGARRLIGVSWTSRSRELGRAKTLPIEAIAALGALPGVSLVDLQYGDTQAVHAELAARHGVALGRVPELDAFGDIDGLAALIAACDAVVTVSNVTAHLAGALGIETHVLVPRGRGRIWYWLDGEGDSVWYPRARLYAQENGRDWSRALAAVRAALTPPIR